MDIKDYETFVKESDYKAERTDEFYLALGLASEVGEVLDILKRSYRDEGGVSGLKDELGDVFWHFCALYQRFGYSFDDLLEYNFQKITQRQLKALKAVETMGRFNE